jgi:aminoglycoside phosphotransferase family enzyme/predicted kinase
MSLPALVAAMLRPEFYPHRPADVTVVQSHISYVLLAGNEVYKVKKPVRFSFLDFSSLAKRRHFCHEEVRLNRRLAGDVYRGVLAICKEGDRYRLGPEDSSGAVEYVVHMRRLPNERMLDRLLDDTQVTYEMIDQLAARLADFHRRAASGPEITANGDPTAIWQVLEDNYSNARPFRGVTIAAADDDAIQDFARTFLQRHESLLRRRQTGHRIRDCHGDLHSEHICYSDGLVIYDCIEFNPRFRYCDVASDIAFLAMDLDYHEQPALAAHLVLRYATYAGDPDLHRLLPLYQSYRAYVRGKVDSLKSVEEEVAPSERRAARDSACRHFTLAYRYTWANCRCLVVISGLSGTGKSAVAAALRLRTGFAHINSDVVRKRLAGVPSDRHIPTSYAAGLYTPERNARTYRQMLTEAAAQLAAGQGAILDATFQRRSDRDAVRLFARRNHVPVLFIECRCRQEEVRRRLSERAADPNSSSDAEWKVYIEQRQHYDAFAADEEVDHCVLDTVAPVQETTTIIERELRKRTTAAGPSTPPASSNG